MAFDHECVWCDKIATFHDDEREGTLLLCNDCLGLWHQMKLMDDIMTGAFVPPSIEEE